MSKIKTFYILQGSVHSWLSLGLLIGHSYPPANHLWPRLLRICFTLLLYLYTSRIWCLYVYLWSVCLDCTLDVWTCAKLDKTLLCITTLTHYIFRTGSSIWSTNLFIGDWTIRELLKSYSLKYGFPVDSRFNIHLLLVFGPYNSPWSKY